MPTVDDSARQSLGDGQCLVDTVIMISLTVIILPEIDPDVRNKVFVTSNLDYVEYAPHKCLFNLLF